MHYFVVTSGRGTDANAYYHKLSTKNVPKAEDQEMYDLTVYTIYKLQLTEP